MQLIIYSANLDIDILIFQYLARWDLSQKEMTAQEMTDFIHKFFRKCKPLYIVVFVVLFSALIGYIYWKSLNKDDDFEKLSVTNPWRESVSIKKEYVAQIRAIQHIEIRSLEKGYLQKTYIDEGQSVKKGEKMFEIMTSLLEAELAKEKAEYRRTKIEYDNTLALHKRDIVSANEVAITKARLDKAQAEMNLADTHVKLATITAPFDGIMGRFQVRLGSLVNEGDLLTTLSDNSRMWVYFNVSEVDYLDYMELRKKHQEIPIQLELANGNIFNQKGAVDTIEADFNNEVGNIALRASFPNPEGLLRHGETGNVVLTKQYENALIIPQKATFEVLDKKFVFVVDKHNKIHDREIQISAELPYLFIVSSGLKETDRILLDGIGKVRDGDVINIDIKNSKTVKNELQLVAS